jgi:hypothetical protein
MTFACISRCSFGETNPIGHFPSKTWIIEASCDDAVKDAVTRSNAVNCSSWFTAGLLRHHIRLRDRKPGFEGLGRQSILIALEETVPTFSHKPRGPKICHMAEVRIRRGLLDRRLVLHELRLRLGELLVKVRRRDDCRHVALVHLAANIDIALADIARGACIDRRRRRPPYRRSAQSCAGSPPVLRSGCARLGPRSGARATKC